jgi:hypothetical protein
LLVAGSGGLSANALPWLVAEEPVDEPVVEEPVVDEPVVEEPVAVVLDAPLPASVDVLVLPLCFVVVEALGCVALCDPPPPPPPIPTTSSTTTTTIAASAPRTTAPPTRELDWRGTRGGVDVEDGLEAAALVEAASLAGGWRSARAGRSPPERVAPGVLSRAAGIAGSDRGASGASSLTSACAHARPAAESERKLRVWLAAAAPCCPSRYSPSRSRSSALSPRAWLGASSASAECARSCTARSWIPSMPATSA